jgi:hypothetical protein
MEDDLVQLIDPHSGQPAVKAIIRPRDVFGEAASPALPDMVVKWHPTPYFLDHVRHPRGELWQRQSDFFRGNDHTQQGFVAAARPDMRNPGAQGDIPLQQLSLTFLSPRRGHTAYHVRPSPRRHDWRLNKDRDRAEATSSSSWRRRRRLKLHTQGAAFSWRAANISIPKPSCPRSAPWMSRPLFSISLVRLSCMTWTAG